MSTIIKARSPFTIKELNPTSSTELLNFTCQDITFDGFAVAKDGTTTDPTATDPDGNSITITDIQPPASNGKRFGQAQITTTKSIYCTFTVPSGYKNTGEELTCVDTTIQQADGLPAKCQTVTIRNISTSDSIVVNYINCGNNLETVTVSSSATQDVCIEPTTYPYVQSGDPANLVVEAGAYGCSTGSNVWTFGGVLYGGESHAEAYANLLVNDPSDGTTSGFFRADASGTYPDGYPKLGTRLFKTASLVDPIENGFWAYDIGIPSEQYKASVQVRDGVVVSFVEHINEIV